MLTSLTGTLAVTTVAASFLLAPSGPAAAHPCEQINVLAFHIEAKPERDAYSVGETAVIKVKVTRPAHEDPAGNGIDLDPPESEAAADINVGAGFHVGDSFFFGFGVTNDKGKTELEGDIEEGTDSGEVDVDIYAWNDVVRTPCLIVREYGYRHYEDMFRIE